MQQAVTDRVSDSGLADDVVPLFGWALAGGQAAVSAEASRAAVKVRSLIFDIEPQGMVPTATRLVWSAADAAP